MRPKTLAEVSQLTVDGDSFDRCVANFLDEFYAEPSSAALSEQPGLLAPLDSLSAVLLLESPGGFPARNLFVSKNALSRV